MEVELGNYIMARGDIGMAGWTGSGYTKTEGSWLCEEGGGFIWELPGFVIVGF